MYPTLPLPQCANVQWQVRVHDAFLVRYAAGAQAQLPLHTDESQISLTLALNDGDAGADYGGGGTFVAELRRALRPSLGHMLSFEGDVFHGGEPIVRGVRYIVAAFLYLDETVAVPSSPSSSSVVAAAAAVAATSGPGSGPGGGGPGALPPAPHPAREEEVEAKWPWPRDEAANARLVDAALAALRAPGAHHPGGGGDSASKDDDDDEGRPTWKRPRLDAGPAPNPTSSTPDFESASFSFGF